MLEDSNTVHALNKEIDRLREGEEGGYQEGVIPTSGQLLRRIHDLNGEQRIQMLDAVMHMAEAGRQCGMSLHEVNLSELRQKTMNTWSALHRISEMCRDPERDGLIHVSEIVELLPEGLRYS